MLLLLSALAVGQETDAIREALNREEFGKAFDLAERALEITRGDRTLEYLRAQAVQGAAWEEQRRGGFEAAMRRLEGELASHPHEVIAYWFGRVCGWAGEEAYGVEVLRASRLPEKSRIDPELSLLTLQRRYRAVQERAREVDATGNSGWISWAGEAAGERDRLLAHEGRAWRVFAGGLAFFGLVVAWLWLRWTSRPPATS